jgi:REP element-mobilizing transposase RayT
MAGTYSQIHVQIVFAVKNHPYSLIKKEHKDEIEKYIAGIITGNQCKLLAIYCNPNHVHILIGSRPNVLLSDLVRKIKSSSSKFIHEKFDKNKHFAWQEGYGIFTYSRSQVDLVIKYILNQETHHRRKTFREEYIDMLKKSRIDFDEKYIFEE